MHVLKKLKFLKAFFLCCMQLLSRSVIPPLSSHQLHFSCSSLHLKYPNFSSLAAHQLLDCRKKGSLFSVPQIFLSSDTSMSHKSLQLGFLANFFGLTTFSSTSTIHKLSNARENEESYFFHDLIAVTN